MIIAYILCRPSVINVLLYECIEQRTLYATALLHVYCGDIHSTHTWSEKELPKLLMDYMAFLL